MASEIDNTFKAARAYQKKGDPYVRLHRTQQTQELTLQFDDGREIDLLHFIYKKSDIDTIRNEPTKVVAAIDEYARTKKYLMNVGEDKGRIVCNEIEKAKPKVMVELGGYVGYSSVLFGDAFRRAGGERYYTLESSPEFAAVIGSLVELAGLSDVVKVIVGDSSATLERLHRDGVLKHVDVLFIDHTRFVEDIKLCERLRLVSPGSLVIADNCIYPGHPEYREYMESSVGQKKEASRVEEDPAKVGNPGLVYDSRLVHSFEPSGEPDGVEISRCTEEAA